MREKDSNVMESARATRKCVMDSATVATRSVRMNASQKDEGPMARESVWKVVWQNAFRTDILAMENVMMECSNVVADATLNIIHPGMDIENAMEDAFQDGLNAMGLVPIIYYDASK